MRQALPGVRRCPKSGRIVGVRWTWRLVLLGPAIGFLALLWFAVRVGPKPSRAAYPCQRAAVALSAGFIAWLLGAAGILALSRWLGSRSRPHRRAALSAGAACAGLLAVWTLLGLPNPIATAWTPPEGANAPLGIAKGINPGRVVWAHDPAATRWDGATGAWWSDANTDSARVEAMLDKSLRVLSGRDTAGEAWQALIRHHNAIRRGLDRGYLAGEKIVVKLNLNKSSGYAANNGSKPSPQVVRAMLKQLTHASVGAQPADITLFDASRCMSYEIRTMCQSEFPAVRLVDNDGLNGCVKVASDPNGKVYFSDAAVPYSGRTLLPTCVTEAAYLVNLGVLRGHTLAGVTFCAKNHFGSIWQPGVATDDGWKPSPFHAYCDRSRAAGDYHVLVDLMGHGELGGKTILYLVDGLYGAADQGVAAPHRWTSTPFNGHWTSSLFASQDPVAIDSVGLDVCAAEPTLSAVVGTPDNYLHQAALAGDPYLYDPEGDGSTLSSLGAHEHWNNAAEKKYSRNLGAGGGIELVPLTWSPVTLRAGYNLVALPVAPWGTPFTAESLAQHIQSNTAPAATCASVVAYAGGAFATHPVGTSVDNFDVAAGKGYFVRCEVAGGIATWTLVGCPLRDAVAAVDLEAGYTLVGLPRVPASPYTAESAGAEILSQEGGGATQIVRYDAARGQFVTHPVGTALENFTLLPGEGYFIRSAGASRWTLRRP